jgi:hypothetical protein
MIGQLIQRRNRRLKFWPASVNHVANELIIAIVECSIAEGCHGSERLLDGICTVRRKLIAVGFSIAKHDVSGQRHNFSRVIVLAQDVKIVQMAD